MSSITDDLRPCDVFVDYPASGAPSTVADLLALTASEAQLYGEPVYRARKFLVNVVRSNSDPLRAPLPNVAAVFAALYNRTPLQPDSSGWTTFVLDGERRPVRGLRGKAVGIVKRSTRYVPRFEELPECPYDGVYLLVWAGSPNVLEHDSACAALQRLITYRPVADVVFYERGFGDRPTRMWSLGAGCGQCDGEEIPFPNPNALQKVVTA